MTEHAGHTHDDQGDGTGPEGTIPDSEDGIAVGSTEGESNFEAEEDSPGGSGDGKA